MTTKEWMKLIGAGLLIVLLWVPVLGVVLWSNGCFGRFTP